MSPIQQMLLGVGAVATKTYVDDMFSTYVYKGTGSAITVNNNVFTNANAVTVINASGSDITITQGSGVTIFNTADATTGNRTLAGRGMATLWFADPSTAYISGAGLS